MLDAPHGRYTLKIQCGGPVTIGKSGKTLDISVSSTQEIEIPRTGDIICQFHDREKLWNILFDIDLIAWIVSLFIPLPTTYKILSDTFFLLWLLHLLMVRKRYYKIKYLHLTEAPVKLTNH